MIFILIFSIMSKNKLLKRKTAIVTAVVIVATILIVLFALHRRSTVVFVNNGSNITIGIIDDSLTMAHPNVIMQNRPSSETSQAMSHGDEMLRFVAAYTPNVRVYYFDATNADGVIDTEHMIEALEWMLNNGVEVVAIPLSTRHYSATLRDFIQANQNKLRIYASYDNRAQSFDYPAMYPYVIGVGQTRYSYKPNDIIFRTNRILLLQRRPMHFHGNSFLAILAAIRYEQ